MLITLRGNVPHIDDGFGEVRALREGEEQVLKLSVEALSAPDPDAEAVFPLGIRPHVDTWRRALAASAVGLDVGGDLSAAADVLVARASDPTAARAYLGALAKSAQDWSRTLDGQVTDLAKARRWITAHPNGPGSRGIPLLIESTAGGGAKIIGGAGGKLNGQELGKLKPGAGGEAKNTREHKAEAEAKPKDLPKSRHGIVDRFVGHEPPAELQYKNAASNFTSAIHRMRREAERSGSGRLSEQQVEAALKDALRDKLDMRDPDTRELKQWADGFVEAAEKHRPATEAEVQAAKDAEHVEHKAAEKAKEDARIKAETEKYERRNKEVMAAQPKRVAIAEKQKATNAPWPNTQTEEAWSAVNTALWHAGAPTSVWKTMDENGKHYAIDGLSRNAHRAEDFADEAEKELASMKSRSGAVDQRRIEQLEARVKDNRRAAERMWQLATRISVQGMPPRPARGHLAKARLILCIPARLAKSTLAPVAAPAQQVRVGSTLAYWRENAEAGRGVLQIPLASGKSLLVLAKNLALALTEGAEELARVLRGEPPARALISRPGQHRSARKPA